ncbi:MAG: Gfo/Idh/MocA family oxidoreductase [Lachnospiraceae bacterium]|nr:Gfo/Idh/MocA family oxidoreductase [Lachnospiraceae bacterium]
MKNAGIIGCGGIAQVHAWVLRHMADVKLCALCDVVAEKAEKLAEGSGDIRITDDWKSFCESDLDVVHVCTPHDLHAPMAAELLRAGKVVFAEKPCSVTREQFRELMEEDMRHPGRLGFCFQNRYNETTRLMDHLVQEGRIGAVTGARAFVTWRRDREYYAGSPWKGRLKREGGGALINQSIHTLDLLLRYLGKPEIVKGSMANHHLADVVFLDSGEDVRIEVEDTIEAWMRFPGGRRACFYASNGYAADAPVLLELQGETGRISMNGQEVTLYKQDGEIQHHFCEEKSGIGKGYWGAGHKACIEDFYQTQDHGEKFQNDLTGVENTFSTMMAIYEAARGQGAPHTKSGQARKER